MRWYQVTYVYNVLVQAENRDEAGDKADKEIEATDAIGLKSCLEYVDTDEVEVSDAYHAPHLHSGAAHVQYDDDEGSAEADLMSEAEQLLDREE